MQMCGITFATIIAAAEQNTTVLKAEVKYDYKHLPNLDVEELRQTSAKRIQQKPIKRGQLRDDSSGA